MGGSLVTTPILIAIAVLLISLLLVITSGEEEEEIGSIEAVERKRRACREALRHPEIVPRIFSREDREFILKLRSPRLQRVYEEERREVALHWVRRTSQEVYEIMRMHRLTSRHSVNLKVSTEASLFLQYLRLRFICGLLVLLIKAFGPHALSDLAGYASELYQLIGRALPDTAAAPRGGPSENPATP
jgi:hypothetical protein